MRFQYFFAAGLIGLMLFLGACSKDMKESSAKKNITVHGQASGYETVGDGLVNAIKNKKLADFQSVTIGTAFDSYKYLTKKEWKSDFLKSGQITVDFTGWVETNTLNAADLKDGVTGKGLNIKFIIEPNGSYYVFMVSRIELKTDGKVYGNQLQDSKGILASIYANKKISL